MPTAIPVAPRLSAHALRLPELHCPFAPAIHPEAASFDVATVAWAHAMGLVDGLGARRFEASKVGSFVSRAYPRGRRDALQVAADWTSFFCLLDDRIERLGSTSAVVRTLAAVHAVLSAGVAPRPTEPLERAAADLHARFAHLATPLRQARFSARVGTLFEAFAVESEIRAAGVPVPLAAYVPMREVTVGLQVEMEIGEIVEGIELGPAARAAVAESGLLRSTSNIVGWANDVFTYEKEIREGEVNNLVAVLAVSEGLDLHRALARAADMHDGEVRSFVASSAEVGGDPELARYAAMLRSWIRGHLDWGRETGRYRPSCD